MICVKLRNNICVNTNGYFKGRLIFPEYALAVWHALWSLCTVPEWRYWDRSLLGCKVFGLYIVQCSCQKLLYNLHCHSAIEKKINAYIDKNFTADAQTSRVFFKRIFAPSGKIGAYENTYWLFELRRVTWDRCYDFLKYFRRKIQQKNGVFYSKQS
jgi:hypothetical protein